MERLKKPEELRDILRESLDEQRNAEIQRIFDKAKKGELSPSEKLFYDKLTEIQYFN